MTPPLTILYTHNLRGDLQLLPRLYTVLRQLQADAPGQTLLLDLGGSCVPEVWPCAVTGGRSTLMVLDAMAVHAANVTGLLTSESRAKISSRVSLALLDENNPSHKQDEVLLTVSPQVVEGLQMVLTAGEETKLINTSNVTVGARHAVPLQDDVPLQGNILHLKGLETGQIGVARLDGDTLQAEILSIPVHTQPDPTIAGVVDLVIEEARYYENNPR